MSTVATVEIDPKPIPFQLGSILVSGFIAGAATLILSSWFGVGGVARLTVIAVVIFLLVDLTLYLVNRGYSVRFYRDHVEFGDESVDYGNVSAAVREQSIAQQLFGTKTYELIAHGDRNLRLHNVAEPDTVERVLADQLPDPATQAAENRSSGRRRQQPRYLTNRSSFWYYWEEEDDALPEGPVVDAAQLGDVLDVSVSSADLDQLDEVDMSTADGLGDIDAGDVGADAGGDGGGGGGFDGGGGGGGE